VDEFSEPLCVVVVQGSGCEALPDRTGQIIKLRWVRGIDSRGDGIREHGLSGSMSAGGLVTRQPFPFAEPQFFVDRCREISEDQSANTDCLGSGRDVRPALIRRVVSF
jgi:hypothetical protein